MTTEHAIVPATPEPTGMLMPAHVAAVVPAQHHAAYTNLSLDQQKRVSLLIGIFREMASAPEGVVAASDRLAILNPSFSGSRLLTLYYAFRAAEKKTKGTGWMKLAKIYRGPSKLPEQFVQDVQRRIENNQVSARAAMTQLKTEWAEGAAIPGFGTWREYFRGMFPLEDVPERFPFGFYPPGWSESNLYDQQSSKAERTLKRRGWAAAKRYLPHVMRSLRDLRFMELIVIDDFETDQLVLTWNPETKRMQLCRCAGLVAIDAATRTKLAIGLKPRFTDDEGKKQSLTRADVQTLLYEVFKAWGLPAGYGCTILCENGGAAITEDFETALGLILGVQVARTGLIHEKTLRNGFVQSGGKPWEKPWIESMFRLMHSTAGALPGQKGATYQLKPADLEAKVLYTEKLLNQEGITPEIAAQLRVPFLKVDEFLVAYDRIFQRMEERTDHKLEGFESRYLFRLPGSPALIDDQQLALLPPEQRLLATPDSFMESPRERRARLLQGCQRVQIAPHILACLLLTPKKVKLDKHRLTFTHQAKGYTFADADSKVMKLAEGTELLGYFDPARPGVLHVMDLKGHYVGAVRSRNRVDIRDSVAIGEEQAEVSRLIHACVVNPLNERHALENAQLAENDAENIRLQLAAGIEKPVRMQPEKNLPDAAATAAGHNAPRVNAPLATAPRRPVSLSRRLAQPIARDAFATYKDELAVGVAEEVGASARRAALEKQTRRDAEHLSPDDIEAATGRRPTAPAGPKFSSKEISDLLRDDKK